MLNRTQIRALKSDKKFQEKTQPQKRNWWKDDAVCISRRDVGSL